MIILLLNKRQSRNKRHLVYDEAVLDAETKLGELTAQMEQAKGARTDIKPMDNGVLKSKAQQLEENGYDAFMI